MKRALLVIRIILSLLMVLGIYLEVGIITSVFAFTMFVHIEVDTINTKTTNKILDEIIKRG